MELKNFVKIFDDVLPLNILSNLIKYASCSKFYQTEIGSKDKQKLDTNIRNTLGLSLSPLSNSFSNIHWANLLNFFLSKKLQQYQSLTKSIIFYQPKINTIEILKYENSGFYTWHVDHFSKIPRTMSCILLLNNDYEGGNLCFRNPDGSGEWEVEVKPNRMIIWPSNFLYPHTVKPVTKGKRYSVVAWAL
jgi:Rps23 Pro-64 3,4-dihydroxylase Tpa1-like proline 4-hydroxylase